MSRRGGWSRLGRRRFRYVDAAGAPIRDEEQLERIAALAIPPAWRDVWISPNPRARIQATGVDAAGRKQYRSHDSFRAAQERAKYEMCGNEYDETFVVVRNGENTRLRQLRMRGQRKGPGEPAPRCAKVHY